MDTDKIIKNNECINDRDIFYLYPLFLKETNKNIGLNTIKLENGIINDLVISVPWKAMLMTETHITINDINLTLSITKKNDSIDILSLENMNSYFATNKSMYTKDENQDLMVAYREINLLLVQYFKKIDFHIKHVHITLRGYFDLTIQNIIFKDNIIQIEKIIIHVNDLKLCTVTNLIIQLDNNELSIDDLYIDLAINNHIPNFYAEISNEDFPNININIGKLTINVEPANLLSQILDLPDLQRKSGLGVYPVEPDISQPLHELSAPSKVDTNDKNQLVAQELNIVINSKYLHLKKLAELKINDLLFCQFNNKLDVLTFEIEKKICIICKEQQIKVKLANITDLISWFKNFSLMMQDIFNKYIVTDNDWMNESDQIKQSNDQLEPIQKPFIVHNIKANIIYGDDIFDIVIDQFCLTDKTIISGVNIHYDNTIGIFDNIIFYDTGGIVFTNSCVKSENEFNIKISENDLNIKTSENDLNIKTSENDFNIKTSENDFNIKTSENDFNIKSETTQILKTIESLDIFFTNANVTNITELINFIILMIDKFISNDKSNDNSNDKTKIKETNDLVSTLYSLDQQVKASSPFMVNLHIKNSNIYALYQKRDFIFNIKKADICVTTRSASDILLDLQLNHYMIANIYADYISVDTIIIDMINIFIDPEIFDQINYLCGTLTPDLVDAVTATTANDNKISTETMKQLTKTLSKSVITESIDTLEENLNHETNMIIKKYQNNNLSKSLIDLKSIFIDDYGDNDNELIESKLNVIIKKIQIKLFDKILPFNSQQQQHPAFLCIIIKDTNFINKQLENQKNKISLKIKKAAVIDLSCHDPEWKYFIKFLGENIVDIDIIISDNNKVRSNINIQSAIANIREETLLRFLAFLSISHHAPKTSEPIIIEYFNISAINILVSYYPLFINNFGTDANMLTLKNYKMKLSSQIITTPIYGIDELTRIINKQWKEDINPTNFLQFVPNIKLLQPIATPIIQIIHITTKYFTNTENKRKIRFITKNITHGADIITNFMKYGIDKVLDLFS